MISSRRTAAPPIRVRVRRTVFALWLAIPLGVLATNDSRADVVPQVAIDVAERWLALVDHGRYREAVSRYLDRGTPVDARAMVARLEHDARSHPRRIARRDMTAWAGHGEGDLSRMLPGGYYRLVFDVVDASGRKGVDEVRMVPRGDTWRVVDYVRE